MAGRITRCELNAAATTEFFKYADAFVQSPFQGGHTMRLASGQLLPMRDARLIAHTDVAIQPNSRATAAFYGITSGTAIWLQIAIVEE
jgi:hypothetical protein